MQASQNGYTKVVQLLVDHGADVNARAEVRFIYRVQWYPSVKSDFCTSTRRMQI